MEIIAYPQTDSEAMWSRLHMLASWVSSLS